MLSNLVLGALALLSLVLTVWQWLAARRFPLHRRTPPAGLAQPMTVLKPLKGCDEATEACLRSWLAQDYAGPVQVLFGVASADDPVCAIVRRLMREFPQLDAQLIVSGPLAGTNLKVSKLAQIEKLAKYDTLVISDADVLVPRDFLGQAAGPLKAPETGLVNCFYRLANPVTAAMRWEAVAVNSDFWSQVLQARSLKPLDFALGAVMITRRQLLQGIGGFESLVNCLADDFHLGNRIARAGHPIVLSPVVVECWDNPMTWSEVWKHQLRWARTIRVCRPLPYFFSLLSNGTLWPLLWAVVSPLPTVLAFCLGCWIVRIATALDQERMLSGGPSTDNALPELACVNNQTTKHAKDAKTIQPVPRHFAFRVLRVRSTLRLGYVGFVPLKDLLQTFIWLLAFLGNRVEWRGEKMRLRRDGTLVKVG